MRPVSTFSDIQLSNSRLSTIVVIMMWLYFCMYLLLVGAHINRFAGLFRSEIMQK